MKALSHILIACQLNLMPCHPKDAVVTMSRRRKIVKPRDDMTSYQLVTLNEGLVTYLFYLSHILIACHLI